MVCRYGGLAIVLLAVSAVFAQDLDSVPTLQKRRPANLADQIVDPAERSAFLQLFEHGSATEMRGRGEAFIQRFPQSAFLAQANEVAARGCFDLGEYDRGLAYARASLALLPENPLLLVPVADVEARLHKNAAATEHADSALLGLDHFAPPSSIRDEDWPKLKRQLESTANFAKGRALLQEALGERPDEARTLLNSAEASLIGALRLNPNDSEIAYLLGLAELSSGDANDSSSSFAAVYRGGGEFASRALENLRAIYKLRAPTSNDSVDTFVQHAADRWTASIQNWKHNSDRGSTAKNGIRSDPAPSYFGSSSCQSCHADIYKNWSESGMSKMFRPYAPQNVVGDFKQNNEFYLGDDAAYRDGQFESKPGNARTLFARMVLRNDRHYFDILQSDHKLHTYPVDYTIGSKFQQAYATRLPNGEIHVFPIQYNIVNKRWVNFWEVIDGPGSERADLRTWERVDASTSYQAVCAVCHTSQLRSKKGGGFTVNNLEFREPGINCEMCHGPSGEHVLQMSEQDYPAKAPLDPPVNFHKVSATESVAICAQCHMQSAMRDPGHNGELNYVPSREFFGSRLQQPFGEFSRKGFYKDGRFRQTTFMVEALERSKCFKSGGVSCSNCHDPHGHGATTNPTSLKFQDRPDLMCTGCHAQFKDAAAIARHSHHSAESEASRCVSCHMPRIMDALLFRARYHQIDDIPNAEMTKRFGQEESPNACLLCHKEKDVDWVAQQLLSWKDLQAKAR